MGAAAAAGWNQVFGEVETVVTVFGEVMELVWVLVGAVQCLHFSALGLGGPRCQEPLLALPSFLGALLQTRRPPPRSPQEGPQQLQGCEISAALHPVRRFHRMLDFPMG